jgi:hypothetical protein
VATLLERYRRGECEAVWNALHGLGGRVRNPDLIEDATAVARETVDRAKRNLESIANRLVTLGYRFDDPPAKRGGIVRDPPEHISERLVAFERELGGPLPLILTAWFEQIGSVSLVGSHPVLCPQAATERSPKRAPVIADPFAMDPFDPTPFEHFRRTSDPAERLARAERALHDFDRTLAQTRATIADNFPDMLAQTEKRLMHKREELEHALREAEQPVAFRLAIAPDDNTKFGQNGNRHYVTLPDPAADFTISRSSGDLTFVEYLRRSFHCGGFAGWHGRPDLPQDLLGLASRLLPV